MEIIIDHSVREQTVKREVLRHHNILLYQGDSTNPNLFDEPFIDLIVTSPPYNVGIEYNSNHDELNYGDYLSFSRQWLSNCFEWSKPQARLAMNIPLDKNKGGAKSVGSDLTRIAQEVGWKYQFTIVWNEGNISRRTAWGSWMSASAPTVIFPVELIVVLYKEQWKKTSGSRQSDISRNGRATILCLRKFVIPAQAGIPIFKTLVTSLDSRFRGNDRSRLTTKHTS